MAIPLHLIDRCTVYIRFPQMYCLHQVSNMYRRSRLSSQLTAESIVLGQVQIPWDLKNKKYTYELYIAALVQTHDLVDTKQGLIHICTEIMLLRSNTIYYDKQSYVNAIEHNTMIKQSLSRWWTNEINRTKYVNAIEHGIMIKQKMLLWYTYCTIIAKSFFQWIYIIKFHITKACNEQERKWLEEIKMWWHSQWHAMVMDQQLTS